MYPVNFTKNDTKFFLSLHYNGTNRYLFVNGTVVIKFKVKDSKIVAYPLYLGNSSIEFFVDKMKHTRLNRYVYDFSVDYDAILVDVILDNHKYLMTKHGMK